MVFGPIFLWKVFVFGVVRWRGGAEKREWWTELKLKYGPNTGVELNGIHLGGNQKNKKSMVIFKDCPHYNALFGLVSYNDPCDSWYT